MYYWRDVIKGLILRVHFTFRFSQWNNARHHRFVHGCGQQDVAHPWKDALPVQSEGHIEGRNSTLRFSTRSNIVWRHNRFSKACCEVTRTINSPSKRFFVYGCTRCSASSAIDWSMTSKSFWKEDFLRKFLHFLPLSETGNGSWNKSGNNSGNTLKWLSPPSVLRGRVRCLVI